MRNSIRSLVLILAIGASALHVQGQILYDLDIGPGPGQSGPAVLGQAGDAWNLSQGGSGTLFQASGSGAPILGFNVTDSNVFDDPAGTAYDSNTANLMRDYAFGDNQPVTLSLSGLTIGDTYTLVIYASGDAAGQGANLSLTGGLTGTGTTSGLNRDISAGEGVAYFTFTGVVSDTTALITVSQLPAEEYTALNGVQLEESAVPEPSTWALIFLALGGAVLFRRLCQVRV